MHAVDDAAPTTSVGILTNYCVRSPVSLNTMQLHLVMPSEFAEP